MIWLALLLPLTLILYQRDLMCHWILWSPAGHPCWGATRQWAHHTMCSQSQVGGGGKALMEGGWVWTLMGANSERWPPRSFSQHPSLVHRSPGLLSSFPGEAARSLPSVGTGSYVGSMILPAVPMTQSHFFRHSFRNWSLSLFNESTSGIVFPCR